tara:strand:+ start:422 stop:763 length:342 start_codon:yes stop_codon:yes gene_type:complete
MSEVSAKLSRLTVSPYKVRLVADQIRGKKVEEAIDILSFSAKSSASNVLKLLESAIANAEHNNGMDIDNLFISEIRVDESFILKRIKARARGRADRIQKRSCHVNIKLKSLSS